MELREYRKLFIEKLEAVYDATEAESLFAITMEELKGWKRTDLALQPRALLENPEKKEWDRVLALLLEQKPVQYIFGKAHFYGLVFKVNEHTLIPRPETEELVEWVITENESKGKLSIMDIGTGSGCIAIALAKNLPDADVYALDVSVEALAIARQNADNNKATIGFVNADILTALELPEKFDIIVSNPPYVRHLEKAEIKKNVLDYEPHLALFVEDEDALLFYRKIALLALNSLNENGNLYFEINQYLGNETLEMLEQLGFIAELRRDIYGNDRMIKARRK